MPINVGFLYPVLALVVWTLVMWLWMYVTRIPAMQKAQINPDDARHPGTYVDKMPANVRSVADNYNHLHEQPTIFYALMFFAALTGGADHVATYLAWAYVGLRVVHTGLTVSGMGDFDPAAGISWWLRPGGHSVVSEDIDAFTVFLHAHLVGEGSSQYAVH